MELPETKKFENEIRSLSGFYGWNIDTRPELSTPNTVEDLLLTMTKTAAEKRGRTGKSLRVIKEAPAKFIRSNFKNSKQVTIVGRTRITEALARHFNLLSYTVRAVGPDLRQEDYPSNVECNCLDNSYDEVKFREGEVVVIASHTSRDPELVRRALAAKASHVAMIGSLKRSDEVLTYLNLRKKEVLVPLFIPAGLDMDAKNPEEIALSIVAEVILQRGVMNLEIAREILVEHSRSKKNGSFPALVNFEAKMTNPVCGDHVELRIHSDGKMIFEIGHKASACAICSASASLITEQIKSISVETALLLSRKFEASILESEEKLWPRELEDFGCFEHLRVNPARRMCALLPWIALRSAFKTESSSS